MPNPKKATSRTPVKRISIPSALAFAALADAIPVPLNSKGPTVTDADVERSKLMYLSLWFHPLCGGRPYAYVATKIVCDGCGYEYNSAGGEYLGLALQRSEFLAKIKEPTWLT